MKMPVDRVDSSLNDNQHAYHRHEDNGVVASAKYGNHANGNAHHDHAVHVSIDNNNNANYQPLIDSPYMTADSVTEQKLRSSTKLTIFGIPFKLYMLIAVCFITFGSYWVFDTPGAIFNQLSNYFGDGNYSHSMNENLYSIYSFPNTVLAFFGGFIIDQLTGVRRGALLFCGLVLLGQVVFCIGIQSKYYWIAFAGRFIFGLGGESLTVAQNSYTVRWFDGKQLALAFGIVVAFSRIGSSVNFAVTPIFANLSSPPGVPFSVWFGAAMCGLSFTFCIFAWLLDWWGDSRVLETRDRLLANLPADQQQIASDTTAQSGSDDEEFVKNCFSRACPSYFWSSIVKPIGILGWILFLITLFFYVAILTFYTVASDILQKTGNKYDDDVASLFLAIPNFVSIIASPLFGQLVDSRGRALYWIAAASLMFIVGHVVFFVLANEWALFSPVPIMIWLGLSYSLGASCLWPILAFIVPKKILGTAYGCMTAVQNTGLAVFPLLIGQLQEVDGIADTKLQYTLPIFIFIGCSLTSFLLTLILIKLDRNRGGKLNASATERAAAIAQEEALIRQEDSESPSVAKNHFINSSSTNSYENQMQ